MEEQIDAIIRRRRTTKILREIDHNEPLSDAEISQLRTSLKQMLDVAAWAPFHYPAHLEAHRQGPLTSIVPWRFYVLEKPACDQVIDHLRRKASEGAERKWERAWNSKIPKLLSGAGALVQATWLPDPCSQGDRPELSETNIEHIAGASVAVQNLLLAGEARGYRTYWSSGGILRDPEMLSFLGIPVNQLLLGSIFITPVGMANVVERPGAHREKRGHVSDWSMWVDLQEDGSTVSHGVD